jgi:Na+-transporting NADH:ubiquinone oxidoreductase subunit NqrB
MLSGKIKRESTSKFSEWASAAWKKIVGKTMEHSFKKCCITNAFDDTKGDTSWEILILTTLIKKNDLHKSVDSKYETRCKSEERVKR